jgi:hypothetical protein
MKKLFLYALCLITLSACHSKTTQSKVDSVAVYHVPDESAIKKAVADAYASISFKAGESPRYAEIKSCFIPQAQLINFRSDSAQVTNINQFIYLYRTYIESDSVKSYSEKELYGKTEQFGKVAHRISTYATYINSTDKPTERGVNSFQLIKTKSGWKVSSIIWDAEKPGLKIPDYYLGK